MTHDELATQVARWLENEHERCTARHGRHERRHVLDALEGRRPSTMQEALRLALAFMRQCDRRPEALFRSLEDACAEVKA